MCERLAIRALVALAMSAAPCLGAHEPDQPEPTPGTPPATGPAQPEHAPPETSIEDVSPGGLRVAAFTASWLNDGAYVRPWDDQDRHLTNAFDLDVAFRARADGWWLLDKAFFPEAEGVRQARGLALSHHIYTPDDIESRVVIDNDRPYAAYLYTSFYAQRAEARVFDHLQVDVGVIGEWAGGEGLQKSVHRIFPGNVRPNGWDDQMDNEPTLNLSYQRRWRTDRATVYDSLKAELIPQAGFRAGTVFTDASAGVTGRIGWNLPDDFGPSRLLEFRDATGRWEERTGFYLFGRVLGRGVVWNSFIDGTLFGSQITDIDARPFVAEAQVGLVAKHGNWELTYLLNWSTEEFEQQSAADGYGQVSLTYRLDF